MITQIPGTRTTAMQTKQPSMDDKWATDKINRKTHKTLEQLNMDNIVQGVTDRHAYGSEFIRYGMISLLI